MEPAIVASTTALPFDLRYLMFLQEWRLSINGSLDWFMENISLFSISIWLPIIAAIIYWCFNKRIGSLIFMNNGFGDLINNVVKLSCCIYRPWIRSSLIKPAGDAIKTAGGYSFPSGHTQCITSYFGTSAILTWTKKKLFAIISLLIIFTVAFSRNYLGVHTPEDVVVGFLFGFGVIFFNMWIYEKLEKDRKTDTIYLLSGLSFGLTMLVYFTCKNYPIEINPATGKILVDPQIMMNDAFAATGRYFGWLIGWYLETQFIKFEIKGSKKELIIRALIGVVSLYFVNKIPKTFWTNDLHFGMHAAYFIRAFIPYFYLIGIYPLIIKLSKPLFAQKVESVSSVSSNSI